MYKILSFILFLLHLSVSAQIKEPVIQRDGAPGVIGIGKNMKDSIKNNIKTFPVTDYKIFYVHNDTITADTILTIRHRYKYNYLFKDDFLRLDFQNINQAYNRLSLETTSTDDILPGFVAGGKTGYWKHTEVPFFRVPSPYSDLNYQNGVSQGQLLNSFITINIRPNLNMALGYRGISSLGLYKHSIVSAGRLFGSLNYQTKNKKYDLKLYYLAQDVSNEENGGIADRTQFEQGYDVYKKRERIDVNFTDADNLLKGKRFFVGQSYQIFKNLKLIDRMRGHARSYQYNQASASELIGVASETGKIADSVHLDQFDNFSGVAFKTKSVLLETGLRYIYQYYSFDSIKEFNGMTYPKAIRYDDVSLDSRFQFNWKKIDFDARLNMVATQNITGYLLSTKMKFEVTKNIALKAQVNSSSKRPDFKYILYQSKYDKYNWYQPDIKNELQQELSATASHKKWGRISWQQNLIHNYMYFGLDSLPHQHARPVSTTALQYSNDFHWRKLGASADIRLQQVLSGKEVLSLPSYVGRASLFFSDYYFHRNLFIQTGFTARYFEAYYANAYNPVLADFSIQRSQKIGNYPLLDFFFNFKVKRFRFFFTAEHFNALWEYKTPTYYAAPLRPYRDFSIRFGVRWIFFN